MDAGFLERLLGGSRTWTGPCVVITDADATVLNPGTDSIMTGGQKAYAPRVATGRLPANSVFLLPDERVLLTVDQMRVKDHLGQGVVKQTLTVVDLDHVVGIEFDHIRPLGLLGVGAPPAVQEIDYRPGTLVG